MSALGGDYAIWVVVAALYVFDAARLLSRTEFLLVESRRRRFAPALSDVGFTLAGRLVAFAPLARPHRAVLVARWGERWADAAALRAALSRLETLASSLLPLRLLVVWTFAWLLVGGPVLTWLLGATAAIYCVAAAVYPTVPVAAVILWWRRRRWGLSGGRIAKLTAEALVCPPTLPNLLRKITASEPLAVDGLQLALALLDADARKGFVERLESHAEELVNELGADHPDGQRLQHYMTAARATL